MRSNGCDYTIDVPQLCASVLNGYVGANIDLGECPSVLVVIVLHLFCLGYCVFLDILSTYLPLWCESPTMAGSVSYTGCPKSFCAGESRSR